MSSRTRAADEYDHIHAKLEELRQERERAEKRRAEQDQSTEGAE